MHSAFLLFLALSLPGVVFSQYILSGKVTDIDSGEGLPGAHVSLLESGLNTVTDVQGMYNVEGLAAGTYTIEVSFVGYKKEVLTVELKANRVMDVQLTYTSVMGDEFIVRSTRVDENSPTAYSMIDRRQISESNTGQDLPYILQLSPSVVTTSDAGGGIGYTGIRIRGTDITRINVTMNGVPVNDPESHAVYFVDLPDLASSVDNIQVQRGVGTSVNGAAAFGASINIQTTNLKQDPYGELSSLAGSFNTFKNSARFGSGLIDGKWAFDGRFSAISSDGYVDRGWSDLSSFYLSGGYYGKKTILKAIVTSGREKTYQAWYGTPLDSLSANRTYNPSGEMYGPDGSIVGYYDNQTDNYKQDYYQLHFVQKLNDNLDLSSALFYTRGKGYYESYRNMDTYAEYGFEDVIIGGDTIRETNLVRQKWLDNDFYGMNLAINYNRNRLKVTLGGGYNYYEGAHFGYIIWAEHSSDSFINKPWYENTGNKSDYHLFGKVNYLVGASLSLYADFQYRGIDYHIDGIHDNLRDLTQSHSFGFFNPKAGVHYSVNERNAFYASVAVANREPNRNAYRDADPGQEIRPERLVDYEAGYRFTGQRASLQGNMYYMDYTDQLVLTGQINNVGDAILVNVPESYRAGFELVAGWQVAKALRWEFNATWSSNKIKNFVSYTDDWDAWPEQKVEELGTTDISFSPDLTAGSILTWEVLRNFKASLISNYVGRQYIDNTSSKDRSLDPYFINNLRFNYTVKTKLLREIEFMLSLNNIFNEEYETNAWVYRYIYDGAEYEMNGYFPQARIHLFGGVSLRF
jgi:iron complex outermembrane receptor protein